MKSLLVALQYPTRRVGFVRQSFVLGRHGVVGRSVGDAVSDREFDREFGCQPWLPIVDVDRGIALYSAALVQVSRLSCASMESGSLLYPNLEDTCTYYIEVSSHDQ